jgi:hypothetical protein
VVFAFSGWFKVYYDHQSSKPKIVGRILNLMGGQFLSPVNNKTYMSFLLYPYLLNSRKNSVHILDYEAYIKIKGDRAWVRLERGYGMEKLKTFSFASPAGGVIKINGLPRNFIYQKSEPVQQGIPLHGWIPFFIEGVVERDVITDYKLVCIDANSQRHVIKSKATGFVALNLLAQVADIELPPDMVEGAI